MHVVEVDFHVGQTVFHRLSGDERGLVTAVHVFHGSVVYQVVWADRQDTSHYAFELSPAPCYARSEET